MFWIIFKFELRYRFAQPTTYLYFGVFALFAFLSQTVEDFGFNTSPKIHVNSPDALAELHLFSSILGMFVTAAVLGTPIYRDDKDGMTGLLYTTPLPKWSYLGGRFLGSLLAMWFIVAGTTAGALLGMLMPWVEASKLGPILPAAPLVSVGWVNALFAGGVFFAAYLLFHSPLVVYLGGRYRLYQAKWQNPAGGPPVAIDIYYDPHHPTNVRRMAQALAYYTKAFGPYQYCQIWVLEFPRYEAFAQSYANTIQPSEGAGFIDDVRSQNDPDLVYFITSHELGHQWWGHQEVGADVQGASMLVESLAEYSASMTAKHAFTPNQMQAFMRRELQNYLTGRRAERKKEVPLLLVENQPYIHYYKGGMVFYALQDYIGEDKLNGALKESLAHNHQSRPPYSTSADLLGYLRRATPDSLQYLLHDMFETITLYKNELTAATYTKRPDGRYDVSLTLKAAKVHADSLGNEIPAPWPTTWRQASSAPTSRPARCGTCAARPCS